MPLSHFASPAGAEGAAQGGEPASQPADPRHPSDIHPFRSLATPYTDVHWDLFDAFEASIPAFLPPPVISSASGGSKGDAAGQLKHRL